MAKEAQLQEGVRVLALPKSVRPVSEQEYSGFIQPMGEKLARQVYDQAEAIIAKDYPQHPWFQVSVCYREAEKDGIHGSSFDLNVIYNSILREMGLGLPSLFEGKHLEKSGALSNGVYREYGLFILNKSKQDLSKQPIAEVQRRGWQLPLVVPSYRPFGHRKSDNGFEVYFLGDDAGIDLEKEVLSGDAAQTFLQTHFNPNSLGKNSVQRLYRDGYGGWLAGWYGRGSDAVGRVDFVSGVASAKNLTALKEKELALTYDKKSREFDEQIVRLTAEREALTSQRRADLDLFSKTLQG